MLVPINRMSVCNFLLVNNTNLGSSYLDVGDSTQLDYFIVMLKVYSANVFLWFYLLLLFHHVYWSIGFYTFWFYVIETKMKLCRLDVDAGSIRVLLTFRDWFPVGSCFSAKNCKSKNGVLCYCMLHSCEIMYIY